MRRFKGLSEAMESRKSIYKSVYNQRKQEKATEIKKRQLIAAFFLESLVCCRFPFPPSAPEGAVDEVGSTVAS